MVKMQFQIDKVDLAKVVHKDGDDPQTTWILDCGLKFRQIHARQARYCEILTYKPEAEFWIELSSDEAPEKRYQDGNV